MICNVVGARPNFIKMAPIYKEAAKRGLSQMLVHTEQHYDKQMSSVFFDELGLPKPDISLGVGSASQAEQTARIMTAFEPVCIKYSPRLVIVAGDVNSTLACALVAAKLNIPVAHVESGLRSFDRTMPEEINRILTDHVAELLFTTEPSGGENLLKEGIPAKKIHFVGNTMIDSLQTHLAKALAREPWKLYGFEPGCFGLVTLHRPSNVDDPSAADGLVEALNEVSKKIPLLFPIHPRTAKSDSLRKLTDKVRVTEPLGYLDFLGLMAKSRLVITDSGGIQEETTALGIPCLTLRRNTERPITLTRGTNRLVEPIKDKIIEATSQISSKRVALPDLWDGRAAVRILDTIENWIT